MWIDIPTRSNVVASFALSHVLCKIQPKVGKTHHYLTISDNKLNKKKSAGSSLVCQQVKQKDCIQLRNV